MKDLTNVISVVSDGDGEGGECSGEVVLVVVIRYKTVPRLGYELLSETLISGST